MSDFYSKNDRSERHDSSADHPNLSAPLDYHRRGRPGKIEIAITKPSHTQADLALAYTPGVAEPVRAIAADPMAVYDYTGVSNLVGIITNGSAILGLGNLGPCAAKPVMEGKALLFKRLADVDVFDIEVDCHDPQSFVDTVKAISPTFGAICLEDIKAPECFEIEAKLLELLDIPVLHDDQHGTAVVVAAGLLNALEIQGKALNEVKIVCLGAGAAGIACMNLLMKMGVDPSQINVVDRQGLITKERENLPHYKSHIAQDGAHQSFGEVIKGADVFIGVSGPNLLHKEHLQVMADSPVIFALSNPDPEAHPDLIASVRPDAIVATGRSDFPNQINNAVVFPYLFRGALDARAGSINTSMLLAAVESVRRLAKEPATEAVRQAYPNAKSFDFGENYIIPMCLDARLRTEVTKAVYQAAMDSGVARHGEITI